MRETDRPKGSPPKQNASFGVGLGVDFKPLGKRIVIGRRQDGRPLKVKLPQPGVEKR